MTPPADLAIPTAINWTVTTASGRPKAVAG
jgi:hypothetical protein